MPKKAPAKPKAQNSTDFPQDFESVAKRLECDEDKERFEKTLGKITKAQQPSRPARSGAKSDN